MQVLGLIALSSLWVLLDAKQTMQEYIQTVLDELGPDFEEWGPVLSQEILNLTSVVRTKREVEEDCDCGPGTVSCMTYSKGKFCNCENKLFVIDGLCTDCGEYCSNAICDFRTGVCQCHVYHARKGDECVPCDCGDKINCEFESGLKFCGCENYLSVNSRCDECVCRDKEFCFQREYVAQCDCTASKNDTDPRCAACDCFNEDLYCSYLDKKAACHCLPHHALNKEGNCETCQCPGEDFECSFEDGQKKCTCKEGFVEQNGTCKECDCGEGHLCSMDSGSKACICKANHVEQEGTCKRCDCSSNQLCVVKDNQVMCECKENFKEDLNGICQECFCGQGHDCELLSRGQKVCICSENFLEHNGICKECDCGTGHTCELKDGQKVCSCAGNFAENNGKCEECFCGEEVSCFFEKGEKTCLCNESFAQIDGKCHEVCHSSSCEHGICEGIGIKSYCRCDSGFSGPKCEQEVKSGSIVLICSLAVIAVLCSILMVIYLRRRWRAAGYKKESLKQTEEPFLNDTAFHRQESMM